MAKVFILLCGYAVMCSLLFGSVVGIWCFLVCFTSSEELKVYNYTYHVSNEIQYTSWYFQLSPLCHAFVINASPFIIRLKICG